MSNHNRYEIQNHIREVINTCKNQAITEVFHRSFMSSGFSSIHTINNRKLTHMFAKFWNSGLLFSKLGKNILIAVPAIIYQMIIGCLSNFIIRSAISTAQITTLKPVKISCSMQT